MLPSGSQPSHTRRPWKLHSLPGGFSLAAVGFGARAGLAEAGHGQDELERGVLAPLRRRRDDDAGRRRRRDRDDHQLDVLRLEHDVVVDLVHDLQIRDRGVEAGEAVDVLGVDDGAGGKRMGHGSAPAGGVASQYANGWRSAGRVRLARALVLVDAQALAQRRERALRTALRDRRPCSPCRSAWRPPGRSGPAPWRRPAATRGARRSPARSRRSCSASRSRPVAVRDACARSTGRCGRRACAPAASAPWPGCAKAS